MVAAFFFLLYNKIEEAHVIPVRLDASLIPEVLVEIDGHPYTLEIDLGSKHQLVLKQGVLDPLENPPCGSIQSKNFKGETWEFPAYRIGNLKLGALSFQDVIAVEKNEECFYSQVVSGPSEGKEEELLQKIGAIGRPLLEQNNLLFDIPKGVLVSCRQKKSLKSLGYSLKTFAQTPFHKGQVYPIITVKTDIGTLNLAIDTGCTFSYIRPSRVEKELVEEEQAPGLSRFISYHLEIGNQDFGKKDFYLLEITSELSEIDGVLGMDFIQNHLVYIDQKEQKIYIKEIAGSQ